VPCFFPLRWHLPNFFLPRLAWNFSPPDLTLPSSLDYRLGGTGIINVFVLVDTCLLVRFLQISRIWYGERKKRGRERKTEKAREEERTLTNIVSLSFSLKLNQIFLAFFMRTNFRLYSQYFECCIVRPWFLLPCSLGK
jgi:hypothetical protein